MKRKITEISKTQERQVIQMKTIAQHQLTNASQSLSSTPPINLSPSSLLSMWYVISL